MANIKSERQKRLEAEMEKLREEAREHEECSRNLFRRRFGKSMRTTREELIYQAEPGDVKRCKHGVIFEFIAYWYGGVPKAKELHPVRNAFAHRRAVLALRREEQDEKDG